MIKYWTRLFTTENKLLQDAHLDSIERYNEGKPSWLRTIIYLLKITNLHKNVEAKELPKNKNVFQKSFNNRIINQYESCWEKIKNSSEGKLQFYFEHKKTFRFEKYLDNITKDKREALTRFRLSCHTLPIERMRYQQVKREERICPICERKEIGNEWHYLLKCDNTQIRNTRSHFFGLIKNIQPQSRNLKDENLIKYCMNMSDTAVQLPLAEFISVLLDKYDEEEERYRTKKYADICQIM